MIVIPPIARHRGALVLRLRSTPETILASAVEPSYEVHVVRFEHEADFTSFAQDPERQRFLHLRVESVRATLLVKGTEV